MSRKKIERNISYDDIRKKYYITLNYGKNSSGENIKKTRTANSLSLARKILKEFEYDKTRNNLVMPNAKTFEDFLDYWLLDVKSINCAKTTLYGYKNIINNHIKPYFGLMGIQSITTSHINKYISQKSRDGLSNRTIRKHYNILFDIFKHAVHEDLLSKNPAAKANFIKVVSVEQKYYAIDQLKKLFDLVEGTRIELPVKLAACLGLRRSEICGLKWKYIDLPNRTLRIAEVLVSAGKDTVTKGTKSISGNRIIYIPDDILNLLISTKEKQRLEAKIFGKHEYEYVFCWEDGHLFAPNYISNAFKKIIDDNGLPHIRFHDLRHSFASIANQNGVSMHDISKALGHSEIGTTSKIYTHLFDKTNSNAVIAVSNMFKDNKE